MGIIYCQILHEFSIVFNFIWKTFSNILHLQSISKIKIKHKLFEIIHSGFVSASFCTFDVFKKTFELANFYELLTLGDYYEFGIYKGKSLWYGQRFASKYNARKMRLFGFDSFIGFPKIEKIDDTGVFFEGQYAFPKDEVIKNIINHNGDLKKIQLIEGYYQDSLKYKIKIKYKMKKAAIIFIDCDLYSSTKTVLEFIYSLLMKNSLILFDNWNAFGTDLSKGERKAFIEFQIKHPNIKFQKEFSYCWHGQVFRVISI